MSPNRRVAVIDDAAELRELLAQILDEEGPYQVSAFDGADTTAEDVRQADAACVILDLRLNDEDRGWMLLQEIRAHPDLAAVPIIVSSADSAQLRKREDELARLPGVFILEKPFTLENLEHLVDCAMQAAAVS